MDIQKVLIADDEKHIREILKMYCEKEGFDVIEAADGAEAILKVQSEKPDILILDIMMPVMDGLEVCKQVRKMSDLPIIMLT
ncbi:response regulator, partial [Phascolarctobacterium faecium]